MLSEVNINIFAYLDYRALLLDYYEARKALGRGFSYRAFAQKAGYRSPSHLKRIIEGERNLAPASAGRYAAVLGLTDEEEEYFQHLIRFTDADDLQLRDDAYRRLASFHAFQRLHHLASEEWEYFQSWYIPVIREMTQAPEFNPSPQWIDAHLRPSVGIKKVERALEILKRLGMLNGDGSLPSSSSISSGSETRNIHMYNYHREVLARSRETLDTLDHREREFSGVTLRLRADQLDEAKRISADFRRQILALEQHDASDTQVMQLAIQFFPLSHPLKSE